MAYFNVGEEGLRAKLQYSVSVGGKKGDGRALGRAPWPEKHLSQ